MEICNSLLFFSMLITMSQCAKILGIFNFPAYSHYILGNSLLRGLAEAGHDVTMMSPFEDKNPPKGSKYRDIVITGAKEEFQKKLKKHIMFNMVDSNPFLNGFFMSGVMVEINEYSLAHPAVQRLLHSAEKFDVVIVGQISNEAHKAIASHFNAHLISFSTIGAYSMVNYPTANPNPLSYIPEPMLSYSNPLPFCERLINFLFHTMMHANYVLFSLPKEANNVKKYISPNLNLYEIYYNVSLTLLNSHPSINQPVPLVPSMIDIGGFHIKESNNSLPDDLKQFLDNAKEGVIYFSLGSSLKSANLPKEKCEIILSSFTKFNDKVKILWKWEEDTLPGKPNNVRLEKWLPQQEILAHPNVKLFISHAGFLSITEAVYYGVPILAIPIMTDQKKNAKIAVNNGIGLALHYSELNEEKLTESIRELIENPTYTNNVKWRSKLFRDRPEKPMKTAIYWIEYVIRTGGAPHLRVTGSNLPWYQYHLLDVFAFLGMTSLGILFLFISILKRIVRSLKKKDDKRKKNK